MSSRQKLLNRHKHFQVSATAPVGNKVSSTIPASEVWLFDNSSAIASVRRGLSDAANGKVSNVDLDKKAPAERKQPSFPRKREVTKRAAASRPFRHEKAKVVMMVKCSRCNLILPEYRFEQHKKECRGPHFYGGAVHDRAKLSGL